VEAEDRRPSHLELEADGPDASHVRPRARMEQLWMLALRQCRRVDRMLLCALCVHLRDAERCSDEREQRREQRHRLVVGDLKPLLGEEMLHLCRSMDARV
jgi:hypothetical protein